MRADLIRTMTGVAQVARSVLGEKVRVPGVIAVHTAASLGLEPEASNFNRGVFPAIEAASN